MEATGSAAAGACPSWCITDHSALINPARPLLGTLKSHLGPRHKTADTCVYGFCYPGLEPEISVYNLRTGNQLVLSAREANNFRELVQCLAKGNIQTVRKFASALGEAIAAIEQETGDDARGGGGR